MNLLLTEEGGTAAQLQCFYVNTTKYSKDVKHLEYTQTQVLLAKAAAIYQFSRLESIIELVAN